MEICNGIEVIKKKDGSWAHNITADKSVVATYDENDIHALRLLYEILAALPSENQEEVLNAWKVEEPTVKALFEKAGTTTADTPVAELTEKEKTDIMNKLIAFFSEFSFVPSFRFVNTLCHKVAKNIDSAKKYAVNYFALINSPYVSAVEQKVKSYEFGAILGNLARINPSKTINQRFKLYYGTQGSGKTTKALTETGNLCMVCHSAMLPSDLMEDFSFDDGKATFKPSLLARCMASGTPLVLDEINLLPFESLRFLQGILDGKTEFEYKGNKVTIADGFKVIGTMNLSVNGMTYGLPEPLVDRCEDIEHFVLTGDMLAKAC